MKLCIDCKWFRNEGAKENHRCTHKDAVLFEDYGKEVDGLPFYYLCMEMRKEYGACRKEGKLWEERETITECSLCEGTGKYFEWNTGNEPVTTFCPICNKNWCRIPKPKTQ